VFLPSYYVPEAVVGAETRSVLIAVGPVGQSPYRVQHVDPHGDSVHMGHKTRTKPTASDKLRRGRECLAASFTQKVSFGSYYDGTVHPRSRPRH
jgi:hypothetical protein